jgi:cytochrome b involved in lipid metabolism
MMQSKLISVIIGVVLVLGVGTLVYFNKESKYVPASDTSKISEVESTVTTTPQAGIPLAEVATHNSRTSCWSAVNGSVYDLTSWIPNHPGGEQAILWMCGKDGSSGYNKQHGDSAKPARMLGGFKLGTLAK